MCHAAHIHCRDAEITAYTVRFVHHIIADRKIGIRHYLLGCRLAFLALARTRRRRHGARTRLGKHRYHRNARYRHFKRCKRSGGYHGNAAAFYGIGVEGAAVSRVMGAEAPLGKQPRIVRRRRFAARHQHDAVAALDVVLKLLAQKRVVARAAERMLGAKAVKTAELGARHSLHERIEQHRGVP